MARTKGKAVIPDNISEEYYQISEEILSSFPKYRPAVDLFQFRNDIAQLYPFFRKGSRLSNEQVEEARTLCQNGELFVSRTDHPIYSQHMVKQVDLVLLDVNLKESEVADIMIRALAMRLTNLIEQPVKPVFDLLYNDLMVVTEYISQDKHRSKLFVRRLDCGDHSLVTHSINTLAIGLWLFLYHLAADDYKRRQLNNVAVALILHDIGMSRIPAFILSKTNALTPDEKDKILQHQVEGAKMLQKFELSSDEVKQALMEHHERLDGSGYPSRTKGDDISKFGKLCAVADSFSAMVSKRAYNKKISTPAEASKELAGDKRYDSRFTTPLANAYLTNMF